MSKARLYFAVVVVSFVAFVLEAFSGFVLWLVLPRGPGGSGWGGGGGGDGASFLFDRQTWLDIHDWTGVALLCFIAVHVALHRKWIVRMLKSLFKVR
jgi:hypothetical protein